MPGRSPRIKDYYSGRSYLFPSVLDALTFRKEAATNRRLTVSLPK